LSRVGKMPITIPQGISVEHKANTVTVKGPKGELEQIVHPDMKIKIGETEVVVERPSDGGFHRSLHGLTRSLIQNMVTGLTVGYEKKLEIIGVGYRAEMKEKTLALLLGYSHPIYFKAPDDITIEVPAPNSIIIKGVEKQLVGQVAAKIRSFRPPEPYKGKGVRYDGEFVKRKAGKATA